MITQLIGTTVKTCETKLVCTTPCSFWLEDTWILICTQFLKQCTYMYTCTFLQVYVLCVYTCLYIRIMSTLALHLYSTRSLLPNAKLAYVRIYACTYVRTYVCCTQWKPPSRGDNYASYLCTCTYNLPCYSNGSASMCTTEPEPLDPRRVARTHVNCN